MPPEQDKADQATEGSPETLRPLGFCASLDRVMSAVHDCGEKLAAVGLSEEEGLVDADAARRRIDELRVSFAKAVLAIEDIKIQAKTYAEPVVRPMAGIVLSPRATQELRVGLDACLVNAKSLFGTTALLGHTFGAPRTDGVLILLADVLLDGKVVWQSPVGGVGQDEWRWRSS